MEEKEKETISPKDYFDHLKDNLSKITRKQLDNMIEVTAKLMKKAVITNQKVQMKKLHFLLEVLKEEIRLIDLGITKYVLKEDIIYFAEKVSDDSVKIVELENYQREIPDDIVLTIEKLKKENIFSEYFVLFTDYTEESEEEKIMKREKDPILFGAFSKDSVTSDGRERISFIHNRFYFIADWVDEYCHLTLSNMIAKLSEKTKRDDIEREISIPVSEKEVFDFISKLEKEKKLVEQEIILYPPKKQFGKKIKKTFVNLKEKTTNFLKRIFKKKDKKDV